MTDVISEQQELIRHYSIKHLAFLRDPPGIGIYSPTNYFHKSWTVPCNVGWMATLKYVSASFTTRLPVKAFKPLETWSSSIYLIFQQDKGQWVCPKGKFASQTVFFMFFFLPSCMGVDVAVGPCFFELQTEPPSLHQLLTSQSFG